MEYIIPVAIALLWVGLIIGIQYTGRRIGRSQVSIEQIAQLRKVMDGLKGASSLEDYYRDLAEGLMDIILERNAAEGKPVVHLPSKTEIEQLNQ